MRDAHSSFSNPALTSLSYAESLSLFGNTLKVKSILFLFEKCPKRKLTANVDDGSEMPEIIFSEK